MVFYKLILTLRINYIVFMLMNLPLELFKLLITTLVTYNESLAYQGEYITS